MKTLLLFSLLFAVAPVHAAPRLVASVRGQGIKEKSYLYLGGGYFPGQGWRNDAQAKNALYPGTRWQIFGLDGPKETVTSGGVLPPDVPAGITAQFRDSLPETEDLIAVSGAGPNAQPRLPRAQSLNQEIYQKAAASLLRAKGLKVERAKLLQLLRVDLNGDGIEEVLMTARSRPDYGQTPQEIRGDYALTALRFVDRGRVKTVPLELQISTKNVAFSAPSHFNILSCVDINGDGKMEVVCGEGYYEGWGFGAWTFDGKSVKRVIMAGWGV